MVSCGAGIGGATGKNGGTVTINGGTVTATCNVEGSMGIGKGIGGDSNGSLTVANGLAVYGGTSENPTDVQTDYASTRWQYMIVKEGAASSKTDLSTSTVTVDTTEKTVTVKIGDNTVPSTEYDVAFYKKDGDDFSTTALTEYPTEAGTYKATVTAKSTSETYTGKKDSAEFTVTNQTAAVTPVWTFSPSKLECKLWVGPGCANITKIEVLVDIHDIDALPEAENVTAADNADVEEARAAYNKLTADQKTLVPQNKLDKLKDAEAVLKELLGFIVTGVEDVVYTGKAIKQNIVVRFRGEPLDPETDYSVAYNDNTNVGTATVTITGKGNFSKKIVQTFKIRPADISGDDFTAEDITLKYTGRNQKKTPVFKWKGKTVTTAGYDIIYCAYDTTADTENPEAVDSFDESYAILLKGKGNYTGNRVVKGSFTGKIVRKFNVTKAEKMTDNDKSLAVTVADQFYNGTAKTKLSAFLKAPTVKDADGKTLSKGNDFEKTIEYSISADGETFKDITDADMKVNLCDYIADNFPGCDYASEGLTVKVEVTLKGNYEGTCSGTYRIAATNISTVKSEIADQAFTGEAITFNTASADFDDIFDIYTKVNGVRTKLVYGVDFEIVEDSYNKNTDKGTASVMIRGLGKYAGTKKLSFKIVANNMKD